MEDLVKSIGKTLSMDQTLLNEAMHYFSSVSSTDYVWLISALTDLIVDVDNVPPEYRCQAALQLKNRVKLQSEAWLSADPAAKLNVKNSLLASLQNCQSLSGGVPMCVHAIANIELPRSSWPELVPFLLNNSVSNQDARIKSVALETIGFICETVDPDCLQEYINDILTAMVYNVRCAADDIAIAALKALLNALEATSSNFARQGERNCLMQVLCESTQRPNLDIALVALQCLCRVISLYYPLMEDYLQPAIFPISVQAIGSRKEGIVLQGLELINSLCDAELELLDDGDLGTNWLHPALNQILQPIVQVLVDDVECGEEWSVGKAAQVSLRLVSKAAGDEVLPPLLPFLHLNLTSADSQHQGAALLCLAAVLEGPMQSTLLPLIHALIDLLGSILVSGSSKVRVSGAMAGGQLCLLHPQAVADIGRLPYLLEMMVCGLSSPDCQVAEHCCLGINNLLTSFPRDHDVTLGSLYCSSLKALMTITEPDSTKSNLIQVGYETLSTLLRLCPEQYIASLEPVLEQLLARFGSCPPGCETFLLLAVESILLKAGHQQVNIELDGVMCAFCMLLNSSSPLKEDIVSVLSRVVSVYESRLIKYFTSLLTSLAGCVARDENDVLTSAAVGLIGDIFRCADRLAFATSGECVGLMELLVGLVHDSSRVGHLRTSCIGTLSDVIVCMGDAVLPLVGPVLRVLYEAGNEAVSGSGEEPEYASDMVKAVIEVHSALVQTLDTHQHFRDSYSVQSTVNLVHQIYNKFSSQEEVVFSLCGLVGDLFTHLADQDAAQDEPWLSSFLHTSKFSQSSRVRKIARWAFTQLSNAGSGSDSIVKKARVSDSTHHEMYTMKVTLSCSGQYITQNIEEESVTVTLTSGRPPAPSDENCNHVNAVVKLPLIKPESYEMHIPAAMSSKPESEVEYRPAAVSDDDITKLRRLRKKRVAVVMDGPKKKSRENDEEIWW